METFWIKAIQLILSLSLLVVIHEFGHFMWARIFGNKVDRFYMFFNPYFHIFSTADRWFERMFPGFTPLRHVKISIKEPMLEEYGLKIDDVAAALGCGYTTGRATITITDKKKGKKGEKKEVNEYTFTPAETYKVTRLQRLVIGHKKSSNPFATKLYLRDIAMIEVTDSDSCWRDTEYGIGWVPLGGYCSIAGMIDENTTQEQLSAEAKPWEYRAKPAWQRLLIITGGVINNFLLAIIIYAGIVYTWGEAFLPFRNATAGMEFSQTAKNVGFQDGDIILAADGKPLDYMDANTLMSILEAKDVTVLRDEQQDSAATKAGKDTVSIAIPKNFIFTANKAAEDGEMFMAYRMPVVVMGTQPGMGGEKAGLTKGDRIVAVNGVSTPSFTIFHEELDKNKGKTVSVTYDRDGKQRTQSVALDDAGKMGIMLTPITDIYTTETIDYSLWQSIPRGCVLGWEKLVAYVSQFKYVFTKEGAESLGGFGAIGSIFPDAWNWESFWSITAFLSVILAFMNILPIPALDGGHMLFILYEMIFRRKPGDKFLDKAQTIGTALLFALLIYANGNDIYRFFFK